MGLHNHGGRQQAGDSGDKNDVDLVQFGRLVTNSRPTPSKLKARNTAVPGCLVSWQEFPLPLSLALFGY